MNPLLNAENAPVPFVRVRAPDRLLGAAQSEAELWDILRTTTPLGVDLRTDQQSLRDWLRGIRTAISEELERRAQAGIPVNEWEEGEARPGLENSGR